MSTELKQAAQIALDALTEMIVAGKSNTWAAQQAVHDLRTALQSAQASEPVAALVRYRRIRTPAHCAFDKKDHYSEWSDWVPCTLSYAKAVTDPARDVGSLPLYEMLPLYAHPAPDVPEGYALVPIAPTAEMLQAALKVATPGALRAAWARMLAAAEIGKAMS